ncbi:MAG: hypothetical protein JXA21_18830 [Anaerolineae bacterium]|nr:hypothetical protein [Anaerolineae bacterium]
MILGAEGVQQVVEAQWPHAETIVVAEEQSRLGMIAAAIAAELDCPLYFALPEQAALQRLGVRQVIAVGDVALPANAESIVLRELEEAQHYYNALIGERPVAVLATESAIEYLAAGVAAYHRGALLLTPDEIPDHRPQYLAWVTTPRSVTKQKVYALYETCRLSKGSQVYDVGVGILTGLTPHDVALLMARAYAYPELDGEWKTRVLNAGAKSVPATNTTPEQPFAVIQLKGSDFTGNAFLEAMRQTGYVAVEAHGSPSGLALEDGLWPGQREITGLPPLIFVAESCETGDIGEYGVDNSVALRVIAGGAAAYISSMEVGGVGLIGQYGFALSTPATPLSTLVRLQSAARMDVDADTPRVILIGDPTFHQFEREWVRYEVALNDSKAQVKIYAQNTTGPVVIALELPNAMQVRFAQAHRPGEQGPGYMAGMVYYDTPLGKALAFDQPLSSALTLGRRTVLLEWPGGDGELILYATRPPGAVWRRILVDGFIGIQAIFIDLFSMPGTSVPLAVVSLAVLLITRSRRKPEAFTLWSGILAGLGTSLLGILYCLGLRFRVPWPVILTVGCGATTVVWILSPRLREWKRIAQCAGLYIAPLVLIWLLVAIIGVSSRMLIRVVWGTILTGLAYGLALLAAMELVGGMLGHACKMPENR